MKNLFRDFVRGSGYLPGYGYHPGLAIVVWLIFLGVLAGLERGWIGALVGGSVMFAIFFPVYFIGCVERTREHSRWCARLSKEKQ